MTSAEPISRALRPVPDVRADYDVETPMRDGTILRCDIFRPTGDTPVPVILQRTPYDKRINHSPHMGLDVRTATTAGYAVVVQDARGRFASEGQFLLTPTQAVEGPDGYDTIEWLAAQPWCNGAVGMIGSSYCSITQLMAAIEQPPHLKYIVPEKTGSPARGAVLLDSIMIAWTAGQAMDWLQKAMLRQEAGEREVNIIRATLQDPQAAARHLPLDDMPLRSIGSLPSFQKMVDLFTQEDAYDLEKIKVPSLVVSGWYDMGRPRRPSASTARCTRPVTRPISSSDHGTTTAARRSSASSTSAPSPTRASSETPKLYLDFYDRHLKGDTTKPAPGAKYFVMGSNEWKVALSWPPAHTPTPMFLSSGGNANSIEGDGTLAAAASGNPDTYRYDPLDPVPSIGGRYFEAGGSRPGPFDQRRVEQRKDVLVYTGEVLDEPLEIAGPVKLRLFMTCSTRDTDLVLKLCDVRPDGVSYNIIDEFLRLRWRDGVQKTTLLEPGKLYDFDLDIGPVAHRFRTGHRLRLQITSSAFPHFDRNMNTGNPVGSDARGLVADITILHDAQHPSALILPVTSN